MIELTADQCSKLLPELEDTNVEITEIKGGITNKLYRVKVLNDTTKDYVFRLYGEKTDMFIDRDIEMKVMKALEPFNISPKVIKYLPERNTTIIEYIDAYTLKNPDFLNENLWEKIIRPIKILHKSKIAVAKVFEPLEEVKNLYKILGNINRDYPEFDISGIIRVLENIYDHASVTKSEFVLCHNDLLADNFMLTNDRDRYPEEMYLIDWEYAGMNTCFYEIADMFQEILVPVDVERNLLEIYWEGSNMDYNIFMTDLFKPFPDIYWFLWSLIQSNISRIDFDYYNYGKVKYQNAKRNINFIRENYGVHI